MNFFHFEKLQKEHTFFNCFENHQCHTQQRILKKTKKNVKFLLNLINEHLVNTFFLVLLLFFHLKLVSFMQINNAFKILKMLSNTKHYNILTKFLCSFSTFLKKVLFLFGFFFFFLEKPKLFCSFCSKKSKSC